MRIEAIHIVNILAALAIIISVSYMAHQIMEGAKR